MGKRQDQAEEARRNDSGITRDNGPGGSKVCTRRLALLCSDDRITRSLQPRSSLDRSNVWRDFASSRRSPRVTRCYSQADDGGAGNWNSTAVMSRRATRMDRARFSSPVDELTAQ